MLLGRCEALQQAVATLRARLPEIAARIRARVGERVAQLGTQVDPARLEHSGRKYWVAELAQHYDIVDVTGRRHEIPELDGPMPF